jgi:sulfide:quinone oxidoreductase
MPPTDAHHGILLVGGGTAGITVAARLQRAGQDDVGIIEPATSHYYQPLWTLVGGGRAPLAESVRPEARVMPTSASWIQDAATDIDPTE